MVEKKRFDGSDATGATGMLCALRVRATASGAVRGVTAAMASRRRRWRCWARCASLPPAHSRM